MDSKPPQTKKEEREIRLRFSQHFTARLYERMLDPDTPPDEQLEMAYDYLEDSANPNMRVNDNEDRLTHIAAQLGRMDFMELFLQPKFSGNINMPNKFWQRPLRSVLRSVAVDEKEEQQKLDMIRFMLRKGANPFQQDIFRDSDFYWMDTKHYPIILEKLFPSSKDWSEEQKDTKLLQLLLADYGGFKIPELYKDQPPSSEDVEDYKKLNTIHDEKGNDIGHRKVQDVMYWVNAMFVQIGLTIPGMQLIGEYGSHVSTAGLDLRNHFVNLGSQLPFRMSDLSDSEVMVTELAKLTANKCYGNKDGTGNLKKMLKGAYKYKRNVGLISQVTDKRETGLRNVEKYKNLGKRLDVIERQPIIEHPIKINGYWIYQVDNTAEERAIAAANQSCLNHLLMENKNLICITKYKGKLVPDPNKNEREIPKTADGKYQPCWMFDTDIRLAEIKSEEQVGVAALEKDKIRVELSPFTKAIGFNNIPAPEEVQEIRFFIEYLMSHEEFGNLEEAYLAAEKEAEDLKVDYDKATLLIGKNPTGPDAEQDLKDNINAWNNTLDDTIRDVTLLNFNQDLKLIVKKHQFISPEEYKEQQNLKIQ
jgi:hypothetical protein